MKKVYEPLNMVMNGRYAVLYKKLEPEVQADVLSRMTALIAEEQASGYADKGNYGHLCNILPTIAIDEVLQKHGKSASETYWSVSALCSAGATSSTMEIFKPLNTGHTG